MRTVRLLSLFAVFLLLVACGQQASDAPTVPAVQGSTPAPASTSAIADADAGLVLDSAKSKMVGGQLALELVFNRRLAGAQDFDKQLRLTDDKGAKVDGGWALDDDGLTLRFSPVQANKNYQVHVDADLTAAAGPKLATAIDKDIFTGPMQPSVGFASRGSVLPARDTRGLPATMTRYRTFLQPTPTTACVRAGIWIRVGAGAAAKAHRSRM